MKYFYIIICLFSLIHCTSNFDKNNNGQILEEYPPEIDSLVKNDLYLDDDNFLNLIVANPSVIEKKENEKGDVLSAKKYIDKSEYHVKAEVYSKDSIYLIDNSYLYIVSSDFDIIYKTPARIDKQP